MNRRNLLTRGIIGAMTIALPLVPAGAQQRLDVSRKAVTDDPVAPNVPAPTTTSRSSSSSIITAPIVGA